MVNNKVVVKNPKPTWRPGIEEDVEVSAVVLSGPTDAEGRHHGDVHVVLPHNGVCRRSDAHGDRVVGDVCDAASPGALTLRGGEDRNIGALAVLRAGAWVNSIGGFNTWLCMALWISDSHVTINEIANKL